jgi:hypothetical protein
VPSISTRESLPSKKSPKQKLRVKPSNTSKVCSGTVDEHLRVHHVPEVSSGVVKVPATTLNYHKGLLARDPEGHALLLAEK